MPLCAGLQRSDFDNKSVTFEEHVKSEHNMWHYLYFIVLIKVKVSTEFTGPESYVYNMVQVRDVTNPESCLLRDRESETRNPDKEKESS